MKKSFINILCIVWIVVICLNLFGCSSSEENTDLWQSATYNEDTEFGSGLKTVIVKVEALDKAVTFTIHSDKETLGGALTEHKLIEGEKSTYGLYVKKVNNILADYDINKAYWAFTKNGESMMTGVDGAKIKDGDKYELTYTK